MSELVNKLYQDIEDKILNNEYDNGQIITEQGIAKAWGVSRTPVREVFQLLTANGYISEDNSTKTTRVRSFTHKDMLDIYDLRVMMEGLSGKLCAQNASDDAVNRLQEIVTLQKMYVEQNNMIRLWELDDEFHTVIYKNSGNRLLQKMMNDFLHYTKFVRKHSYEIEGKASVSVNEHYEIFGAIKARESGLAEKLLINHTQKTRNAIA